MKDGGGHVAKVLTKVKCFLWRHGSPPDEREKA